MARVVALVPDLLFGSQVQGMLVAAGHEVELVGDENRVRESRGRCRIRRRGARSGPEDRDLDGPALVESLTREGVLGRTRTLGFYSHVDVVCT